MGRWILTFALGVIAGGLIVAGLALTATRSEAQSESNWQVHLVDESTINNGFYDPDPDQFMDDFITSLSVDCDIVFAGQYANLIYYRCPED